MLYREIIAVCSQIHTKHTNTLCELNVELLKVKPGGKHSDDCALKCSYGFFRVFKTYLYISHSKHGFNFHTRNSSNNHTRTLN